LVGCFLRFHYKLSLDSEIGHQMHFSDLLGLEVDFEANVSDEVRGLNSKSAFLAAIWKSGGIEREFACESTLVVLDSIVVKNEISGGVEEYLKDS
jgi:hypothetical protein